MLRGGAYAVAAALLLLFRAANADKLDDLIDSVESVVNRVADEATAAFRRRFDTVVGCRCSHHACGSEFASTHTCHEELGDTVSCPDCSGQKLDFNKSFILTAPVTEIESMTPDVKDAICTFQGLDTTFANAKDEFGIRAWSFVATTNGVMRNWPGHGHDRGEDVDPAFRNRKLRDCKKYDPRFRPWYVAASSGPKDVVLLIDTSGSMLKADDEVLGNPRTRWDIVKQAILELLETFSASDYINMVVFSDKVRTLIPDSMVQGTSESIELLKAEVEQVDPEGGTDFRLGMQEAFDLLITAASLSNDTGKLASSNCQKVILFLTDGKDCTTMGQECEFETPEDETPVDAVLQFIDKKQEELEAAGSQRAHIFPFSFGFEADDEIPKEMACGNEGVWGQIQFGEDPLFKMNAYTSYLASKRGDALPIWSRLYKDEFGLGEVVTAARPIYSPKTSFGEDGSFVGVVGHDVRIEDFEAVVPEFLVAIRRFIFRGRQCIDTVFTGCELQLLRGQAGQCPEKFEEADCYFFEKTGDYYIAPKGSLLTFDDAVEFCKDMGGELAEIDKSNEEDLLSGLASNAGSWVGLRFDRETETWRWRTSDIEVPRDSELWIFNANLLSQSTYCATLDRRGVRHNVHPEDCSALTHPICEFTADSMPDVCKNGKVIKVDASYEYNVRPLSTCRREEEELLAATATTQAAASLSDEDVICPLGEELNTFDVRCCDDCKA